MATMENYSYNRTLEECKNEFLGYLEQLAPKREGMDKLIKYLTEKSDFFEAPAGLSGLESREGGLLRHSLNVLGRLLLEVSQEAVLEKGSPQNSDDLIESCFIIALLSGVWKAGYYEKIPKEVKTQDGQKTIVTRYAVKAPEERLCYGRDNDHGDMAVYILSSFIRLTRREALIIRSQEWDMSLPEAVRLFRNQPLALSFHIAQQKALFIDECEKLPTVKSPN